ncbi:flavodoxin domain-containing protein [Patescibacteria group bacterium]
MNILVIYATNSGATEIVSQLVQDTLTKKGHTVTRKEVSTVDTTELTSYDSIILGSPSWDFDGNEGWPHQNYLPFIEQVKSLTLEGKKFAVFGLGDSSYTHFCGAVNHLEDLIKTVKGNLIVESLKIDGFYFKQAEHTETTTKWAEDLSTTLTK